MLQYRHESHAARGMPMYAPTRDIVYLMPLLVSKVPLQLQERTQHCPAIATWLAKDGITEEDLAIAYNSYVSFVEAAHTDTGGAKIYDALQASGWGDAHPAAKAAVLAAIAQTLTFTYWQSVREATKAGQPSPSPMRDMLAASTEMMRYANMPRWQRWLYRWRRFFDWTMQHIEVPW